MKYQDLLALCKKKNKKNRFFFPGHVNFKLFNVSIKRDLEVAVYYAIYGFVSVVCFVWLFQNEQKILFRLSIIGTCIQLYALGMIIAQTLSNLNYVFYRMQPLSFPKFTIAVLYPILLACIPFSGIWFFLLAAKISWHLLYSLLLFLALIPFMFFIVFVNGNTLKSGFLIFAGIIVVTISGLFLKFLPFLFYEIIIFFSYRSAASLYKSTKSFRKIL